jgi:predicted MPP superfamily phosphohydrolase
MRRLPVIGAAAAGLALLAFIAFWGEPRSLTARTFSVETPSWMTEPLRVALVSDVHVDGVHMRPGRVARIVERVGALRPDVVLLAGDYVGGHLERAAPPGAARAARSDAENVLDEAGLRALGALRAPLGVYAVMGNHDCWWDCARVREILTQAGVIVLENRAIEIAREGGAVWIAGVEDGDTQRPDFAAMLAQIPADAAALAVAHDPGLFDWPDNRAPIQLSGHSHAGQVRFPLIGAPVRMARYTEETADGFMVRDGRILIVTRGVGETGLPVRFGAAPEIMILEIARGDEARATRRR